MNGAGSGGGGAGGAGRGLPVGGAGLENGPAKLVPVLSKPEAEAARLAKLAETDARAVQAREGEEVANAAAHREPPPTTVTGLENTIEEVEAAHEDAAGTPTIIQDGGGAAVQPQIVSEAERVDDAAEAPEDRAESDANALDLTPDLTQSQVNGTHRSDHAEADADTPSTSEEADETTPDADSVTARKTDRDTGTASQLDRDAPEPLPTATASPDFQPAVDSGKMPPVAPDTEPAVDPAVAQREQAKNDEMQTLVKEDASLHKILQEASIIYDPTIGINIDAEVATLEGMVDSQTKKSLRSPEQERALRRLKEVQGIANLHEAQKDMQGFIASGKKVDEGEGVAEYEEIQSRIDKGRQSETQRELRGKMQADQDMVRLLERAGYSNVEDVDVDSAMAELASRKQFKDLQEKGDVQKAYDRLREMRDGVRKEHFAQDVKTAQTDAERNSALAGLVEASKSERGPVQRLRDKVGRWANGLSHEQLQYLHNQAKGYKEGLKFLEKKYEEDHDPGTKESIDNLRKMAKKARNEWLGKLGLKILLLYIAASILTVTVAPAIVTGKVFQTAGKAPQ